MEQVKRIDRKVMRQYMEVNRETLLEILKLSIEDPKEEILDAYIDAKLRGEIND